MLLLVPAAVADPQFSVARGLFDAPFELEVTAGGGGTVYCSSGGVEAVCGPLAIEGTTVVRAREVAADGSSSPAVTHTYLFVADVLRSAVMDPAIAVDPRAEASLRALPSISIVAGASITTSEAAASIEWIDPEGEDTAVIGGIKRVGGASISHAKNSFRLNFRGEYGVSRWEIDLYGDSYTGVEPATEHDSLTLRGGNHDTPFYLGAQGQYLRNFWMDETQLAMGHLAPHGRFAHVYLDGAYDGVYHVRERFDAAFLAEYLGGSEDDYEAVNGGSAFDGSGAAWSTLVAASNSWEDVQRHLDVENFLDYMVLNFYAGNAWDWSYNHNWIAAGPASPGRVGFVFHSSDSDICLYYDWTVDILSNPGPSSVFGNLLAEGHPDFMVALADAIHRNLSGPLSTEAATDRYQRLAGLVEDAIVAESARWGGGWWDRDGEWETERDRLLGAWFPYRTDAMFRQFEAAGWYPLEAPVLSESGGVVTVALPEWAEAEVYTTVDGEDPRLPGGEPAPQAVLGEAALAIAHSSWVRSRLRQGETWGPLAEAFYEVDAPPALVLNEWNAISSEHEGDDAVLGVTPGNGGDWLEFVVVEDGLDLRGWRLTMEDRVGSAGELRFSDAPVLATLRAGTILTIAEELPEDTSYDPASGDWRFHLRVGGEAVAGTLDVTHVDWQLTAWDADGAVRFGPVGEGVAFSGISSSEVGMLAADPGAGTRRDGAFAASGTSTFGAPNAWDDEEQDLSALRGEGGTVEDVAEAPAAVESEAGCGCAGSKGASWLWIAGLLALLVLGGCTAGTTVPADAIDSAVASCVPEAEVCDGADNDCDGIADEEPVDGVPFFADEDNDGHGSDVVVTACTHAEGLALTGGDCADGDPEVHPGAVEVCDDIDQDCDGLAGDAIGASTECPADSCEAIRLAGGAAVDGAMYLRLPSGVVTAVWCDMTTDGGGWTLGFVRNTASTGSQGEFGAGEVGIESLADSPAAASASAVAALGWHDLNAFDWTELRLSAFAGGSETYTSRFIPRDELRIAFGDDGYLLYGTASGYWWCGGNASYTDAGTGAVNNPADAPPDCKGHGSLGSGWDFSESAYANAGLTLCGGDGSYWLAATWGGTWTGYGAAGGAQAIWVR